MLHADAVVVAVPAPAAAGLLRAEAPEAAAELAAVEYASMALITLAYRRAERPCPRAAASSCRRSTGAPSRRPPSPRAKWGWIADEDPDLVVLRTSVGRYGETEILQRDDAELVDVSRHDLRAATGLDATPVATRVTRWDDGLPQYPVGHHARVARIREHVAEAARASPCAAPRTTASASRRASRARTRPSTRSTATCAVWRSSPPHPVQSLHGGAGE